MQDIPNSEDFEWDVCNKSYPGIPLKHFLDNWGKFGQIEHDAECPTESHESFYKDYMHRIGNEIHSYEPQVCPAYPRSWTQWHDEFDVDKLRRMPLKTFYQLDLTNHVKNPQAMAPKQTKQHVSFSTYLIGPNKAVVYQTSQGRDYMFSDRFTIDILFTMTQTVDPNIENETDPAKIMKMFTTEFQVSGRMTIKKSLGWLKGKVLSSAKVAILELYTEPIADLE